MSRAQRPLAFAGAEEPELTEKQVKVRAGQAKSNERREKFLRLLNTYRVPAPHVDYSFTTKAGWLLDFALLADGELGSAPADPGTYEGGHAKPTDPSQFPNKWCVRECERCAWNGEPHPDFSQRRYNMRRTEEGTP